MDASVGGVNATADRNNSGTAVSNPASGYFILEVILSPAFLGTALVLYAVICSSLRFRFEKRLRQEFPKYTDRASMASMTHDDAQSILKHIGTSEFPFTYKTALQFGIFKTYGFPTMSRLMVATKSFIDPTTAPKRYEDTTVLFEEQVTPEPRMNAVYILMPQLTQFKYTKAGKISNEDFLYTLSVCITEPIRFIDLYEWRKLNDMERNAIGTFWKGLGDSMEIEYKGYLSKNSWRDGIEFIEDITAWAKEYEIEAMKPAKSNAKLAESLVDMLIFHAPHFMKPFATEAIAAVMGDRLREAFLYPEPSLLATTVAFASLLIRQFFLRYLFLPRTTPVEYMSEPDSKTGRISHNDYLVKPLYQNPTFWNRWGPIALVTRAMGGYVPGPEFVPEGYLVEEIGPASQSGQGLDAMQKWQRKMEKERPSGCPFSR